MDELEGQEEIFADRAPEAELEERLQGDVVVGGMDGPEDADGLWPDVDAA
jgi:hypothetical protein